MNVRFLPAKNLSAQRTVVAIGNFDGIHLGHQKILQQTVSLAAQYQAIPVLLTFEPYPQAYFSPNDPVGRLTNLREKVYALQQQKLSKIKKVYILKFTQQLSLYSPEEFIQQILKKQLKTCGVIVGEDFRFGYHRQGDVDFLKKYLSVEIVPPVLEGFRRISSTWIREALNQSNFQQAKKLLGRDYTMIGRVIKGCQRGKQMGFPTANIALNKRMPALTGVFAVKINQQYTGIANIGSRPTLHQDNKLFLEVHLLNFDQNIYGQLIEITFLCKIREEKKFDSFNLLKLQIQQDAETACAFFNAV